MLMWSIYFGQVQKLVNAESTVCFFFFLTKVAVPIAQQYAPKKDFIQDFSPLTKITPNPS